MLSLLSGNYRYAPPTKPLDYYIYGSTKGFILLLLNIENFNRFPYDMLDAALTDTVSKFPLDIKVLKMFSIY